MNKKKYVICTTARSGSNLLCDLLESSQSLGCPREILNVQSMLIPFSKKHSLFDNESQITMNNYLNRLVDRLSSENNVFGMKILFDQLEPFLYSKAVKHFLQPRTNKLKFIWLVRRDIIAQAVSMYIATITNEWTSSDEAENQEKKLRNQVQYDRDKIDYYVKELTEQNLKWLVFFAINQIDYLQVFYEDIIINPEQICQDICQFCEIEVEHKFSLNSTNFKKQGNELNEKLVNAFKQDSCLNLDINLENNETKLEGISILG